MRKNLGLGLVIIFIAAALVVFVTGVQAQTEEEAPMTEKTRTVSVNGTGTVSITPDIAIITVGVRTDGEVAQDAVTTNNQESDAIIAALKNASVKESDIRTTNFSIHPRQDYGPDGEIKSTTYVVNNSVSVTVRNLDQVGDVLDAAVKAGANNIGGIQFDVSDREGAQQQAMVAAVDNARERAEVLAGAAEVEVGAVVSIQSYVGNGPSPVPYERTMAVAEAAVSSVPVAAGEMQITVDVSVVYEIK